LILSFPSISSDYPLFSFRLSVRFSLLVADLVAEVAVEMGWLSGQGGGETVYVVEGELQ
jgi:predicted nucleotidyltransferase